MWLYNYEKSKHDYTMVMVKREPKIVKKEITMMETRKYDVENLPLPSMNRLNQTESATFSNFVLAFFKGFIFPVF